MQSSSIIMPIAIIIIMFGIGLNLTISDFKRVFIQPKAIITGLVAQLVILPAIAFLLVYLWPMDPIYKVGFILVAACPGGTASNLVTHMLKGRVALSVSLTSFNSFIIVLTIPLYVGWASGLFQNQQQEIDLNFYQTIKEILYTVLLPVIAGILVRMKFSDFALKLKKPLRYIMPLILLLVFAYVLFFGNSKSGGEMNIMDHFNLFWPAIILNVLTMAAGFFLPGLIGINHQGKYTIAVEMGLQNSALAIFIANEVIQNQDLSMVALIYSSFTFFSTLGIGYFFKKRADDNKTGGD